MEYIETAISYITELFSNIDWDTVLGYLTTIYETIAGLIG